MSALLASFALSNAKHDLGKLWAWLCHRSFWQLAFGAALAFAAYQTIRIEGFKIWPISIHGLKADLRDTRAELAKITDARDRQKRTTERTVREVVEGQERVKTIVRVIHDAPNPEGCATPGLELLRNTI